MSGLTLLETLLVVGVLAILLSLSLPLGLDFYQNQQLDSVSQEITQTLRRAQLRAMAGELDSSFGLFFANSQYVLFKGDSYLARDSQYDEVFEIAGAIALSGLSEIVFLKLEGKPKEGPEGFGGAIILSTNSNQKTIGINGMGRVNLE